MKPMISAACKDCGGEDCVCCEIYAEEMRPSYEDDYPFEDGSSRHYDDYEEDEE